MASWWFVSLGLPTLPALAGPLADVPPPGKYFKLKPADHRNADTFKAGKPIIGTTYFYWYDVYTGAHIRNADGSDALTDHPPADAMADVSYRSPDWHLAQLRDICSAGIDFIMPVFWGLPGDDECWSITGLPPLVDAWQRLAAEHERDPTQPAPPRIGLFYDTSTLRFNPDGPHPGRIDLTTPAGREWFYVTIRDFFSMIPPATWARIDGRPIIFLYAASFAADVDARVYDEARRRFRADFGTDFFLVRHVDWPPPSEAWYRWGGACGLLLGDHVAALGPGYDHSAVPGREPLIVPRQRGRFYEQQWEQLLKMHPQRRPWIVHVETWNEWHEGTDIARSQEYGDQYIKLTARYAAQFRAGRHLPCEGPFANASRVRWSGKTVGGLRLCEPGGDGYWEWVTVDGDRAIVSVPSPKGTAGRFLYFDVDDSYLYDEVDTVAEVAVTFLDDGGCDRFHIDYDCSDPARGVYSGAFAPAGPVQVGNSSTWRTARLQLPDVRFVNRAHKADFRLAIVGGAQRLTVREVIVRRLPGRLVQP